ncbi:dihydrolipoamide dehydrogenase [compost metagenome]
MLLVSNGPLGGTCVNFGCVPTKFLLSRLSVARRSGSTVRLPDLLREASKVSGS